MRNISFFITQGQFRQRTKTVTRRLGWKNLKVGDQLMGVVKGQGLRKGEKIERLGPIEIVAVRREWLDGMLYHHYGKTEPAREGFPEMTAEEFVNMFCNEMKCEPSTIVTRIEFKYL